MTAGPSEGEPLASPLDSVDRQAAVGLPTRVHLLRHGEVHNPDGILYGRLPGFRLSDNGARMAQVVADDLARRDLVHLRVSPLQRARETVAPLEEATGLVAEVDERLVESENVFEGTQVDIDTALRRPELWRHLYNPFRPSWGEPFAQVAARVLAGAADARDAARRAAPDGGGEAVCVLHQLPIWVARRRAEGRRLWHDPRQRQCGLASVTTLVYDEADQVVAVEYREPAAHLNRGPQLPGA